MRINLLFQKSMPVPMQLHTACVCGTMGSAWASRAFTKTLAKRLPAGAVPRFPQGGSDSARIKFSDTIFKITS